MSTVYLVMLSFSSGSSSVRAACSTREAAEFAMSLLQKDDSWPSFEIDEFTLDSGIAEAKSGKEFYSVTAYKSDKGIRWQPCKYGQPLRFDGYGERVLRTQHEEDYVYVWAKDWKEAEARAKELYAREVKP